MFPGVILELVFKDAEDKDIIFWFNYAKQTATFANVKALMNSIIENGDIFNHVPVKIESAKTITTTYNEYDFTA